MLILFTYCPEPFPTPHDGSLRLAEGLSTNVGRVEIYYQGEWGTICGNEWTYGDAGVICRQLGYPGVDSFSKGSPYEEGSGPIMGVLGCRGYEWFWQDCPFDEWSTPYCSHTEDANVACSLTGKSDLSQSAVQSIYCYPTRTREWLHGSACS